MKEYDTLSEAVNDLSANGYTEDFHAHSSGVKAIYAKKEFAAEDLLITKKYHFEGDSDPDNLTELFVIEAKDGTKGTLVMSGSSELNQDASMIRKIPLQQ